MSAARRLTVATLCALVGGLAFASAPALATGPPGVEGESFSSVGSASATLSAQVDPGGLPTTYTFEYGASEAYGSSTPVASAGAGSENVAVTVQLGDLEPEKVYHFRLVASNEAGATDGADVTFSTLPAGILGLPDGRGYEMVSPVSNSDGNVFEPASFDGHLNDGPEEGDTTELPFEAAADGNAVAYVGEPSAVGGGGSEGNGGGNQYLASRAPGGGWTAENIDPPSSSAVVNPFYEGFSSDLSVGVLDWNGTVPLAAGAPAGLPGGFSGYSVLYGRTSDGGFHPFFTVTPPRRKPFDFGAYDIFHATEQGEQDKPAFAGASANFEQLLFEANDALTAKAEEDPPEEEENDLYESVDGQLRLVNVLPDGQVAPNAIFGSPADQPNENPLEDSPDFSDVISENGSRVFWTDLNTGVIYVREGGTSTVAVSEGPARFWAATPDGRYVFYAEGETLWRLDVESETRVELAGAGAGVQGVVGASDDGSYLYFVADGALAPGASAQTCHHTGFPGTGTLCNLYLFHEGEPPRLVATVSGEDDEVRPLSGNERVFGDWRPGLGNRTAEVTPDGRHLVFMSEESLTGYDNAGEQEVYLYDAEGGGHLFCVSCNPSGELPTGVLGKAAAAYLPPSFSDTYMHRWMSEDGSRVFFDGLEALVPQDTDGRQDVYEWERDGTGGCQLAAGCVYLLSDGTSTDDSFLADASASGDDVFIVTRAQLTAQDQDENYNLFDARVGAVQPLAPPACSGSGCQGVPGAPPVFATPSSVTFNGVGNFGPPAPSKAPMKAKKTSKPKAKRKQTGRKRRRRRGGAKSNVRSDMGRGGR